MAKAVVWTEEMDKRLGWFAGAGFSVNKCADALGLNYQSVFRRGRKLGLAFKGKSHGFVS